MKVILGVVVLGTVLGTVRGDCSEDVIHDCLHELYDAPVGPYSACGAIKDVKACFYRNGCCEEYETRHCLKVMDRMRLWREQFAEFNGCSSRVCHCTCDEEYSDCGEFVYSGRTTTPRSREERHASYGGPLSVMFFFFVYFLTLYYVLR